MNKFVYLCAKARNVVWCAIRKVIGLHHFKRYWYYGKRIKGYDDANQIIYNGLISGKPFLVARYGDAELRALVYALECDLGLRSSFPNYCLLYTSPSPRDRG